MTDTICKGCGRSLAETGTTRVAAGRRYSQRHGWHNATAKSCAWCGTWVRWPDDGIPHNVDLLIKYAEACGSHFFDADTMRFFKSRILDGVTIHDGRAYFVTSERFDAGTPRRYSARYMVAGAHFFEVGEFQEYATARQARQAIAEVTA